MKLAFFIEGIQFTAFNSFCQGSAHKLDNFHKSLDILVLFTNRNSFIYEILNEVLDKTIPTGIPQYLIKYHESVIFKNYEPVLNNSPKVLTLDDLWFGFILWLGACGISTFGFLMEHFRVWVTKHLNNLIGLWMLLKNLSEQSNKIIL